MLGDVRDLPAVLDRERVDELIVTDSDFGERELLEIVDHAHRRGVEVRIAPKATELLTSRAEFVPGQGIPLFELRPPAFIGMDWVVKRAFDLVVSGLVLVVGLPSGSPIAAAVKLNSRGPVLLPRRRVGLGDRSSGCSSSARCAPAPPSSRPSSRRRTRRTGRSSRCARTRA